MSERPAVYAHTAAGGADALEQQLTHCGRYLQRLGFDDWTSYRDQGGDRSSRDRMLRAVDDGQHSLLVVWDIDRLFRSVEELLALTSQLAAAHADLHTANEGPLTLRPTRSGGDDDGGLCGAALMMAMVRNLPSNRPRPRSMTSVVAQLEQSKGVLKQWDLDPE